MGSQALSRLRRLIPVGIYASISSSKGASLTLDEVEARAKSLASRPRFFGGNPRAAAKMLREELYDKLTPEAKVVDCVRMLLVLRDLENDLEDEEAAHAYQEEARQLLPFIPEPSSKEGNLQLIHVMTSIGFFDWKHALFWRNAQGENREAVLKARYQAASMLHRALTLAESVDPDGLGKDIMAGCSRYQVPLTKKLPASK